MRNELYIAEQNVEQFRRSYVEPSGAGELVSVLDRDGIVVLPELVSIDALRAMQNAFRTRLRGIRWNNFDGYQRTELYRQMVPDVLQLEQGFIDLVLHPTVKHVLNRYLGADYALTEAKGWKSLPTKRDFHGWHGDAWYDQTVANEIHREVKLAIYLTDVRSGAFNYIKGSHRQQHPRLVRNSELGEVAVDRVAEVMGTAGTAFLFDTSGIHRQGVPMLEEREACFFNFHNPNVRVQKEDLEDYRYHPLILNAAFLGDLSEEDQRILGFGNKTRFNPTFVRTTNQSFLYRTFQTAHAAELRLKDIRTRATARLGRLFRRS